jgi:Na+-translocating ferredoxin:NAD+ oxidoreductase subunit B
MSGALAAGLTLAVLAVLLSGSLLLAGRFLRVDEDKRLEKLVSLLPGINCGACGQPGCRAFAEALLSGEAVPAGCSVSSGEARQRIADYLGVAVGEAERRVARLACAGDINTMRFLADYQGELRCAAAAVVDDGGKACAWGCLGLGDCERSCDFDAIDMSPSGLPVVNEANCTACGDCVRACPKDLFSIVPEQQPLWVACNNPLEGNDLLETCKVACTACERCIRDAPDWLTLKRNLPVPIEGASGKPPRKAIDRCPTGAIVWMENGRAHLGASARLPLVIRSSRQTVHQ